MRMVLTSLEYIDALNDWIGRILSYAVLLMFVVIINEVVRRYVFNAPTVWGGELAQLTFGVYVILSGGHIMRWGGHVNVDIVYSRLGHRARAVLDVFTSILFFCFAGMLFLYGGSMALDAMSYWEHSISAWAPPLWPFKLMIPVGAALLILQGIAKLIRDIHTVITGIPHSSQDTTEKETV